MAVLWRSALFGACLVALAACESTEQRAEQHFESALALLEEGDTKRAMVEFRNVISLQENHLEARRLLAETARENGNIAVAYAQFSRLIERAPEDHEARLALTEMAVLAQNWDEAERHGRILIAADPKIKGIDTVRLAIAFREALVDKDQPKIRALTAEAEAVSQANPDDPIVTRMLLEGYLTDGRLSEALVLTDRVIEQGTDNRIFYQIKGEILASQSEGDLLEEHFRAMLEKFPDDDDTKGNLIRLLIAQDRGDRAEDFLRAEIDTAEDKIGAHVGVIAFVRQFRGEEAALEEIEVALAAYDNPPLILALKGGLLFDTGKQDEAIALMQSITDGAEPSLDVNAYKVTLAKMLVATGNEVGARQLIEAVLEHDKNNVEALKMHAQWQIQADQMDLAIASLRIALDGDPEDAEAMTIMARAHERNGDRQLANDLLALAVEASGNAVPESLRFASVQASEERFSSAEETLINALRRTPGDIQLLAALGDVYLQTQDWGRAAQVIDTLRRQSVDVATAAADQLQVQLISRREGRDQGIAFLEELAGTDGGNASVTVALIRAKIEQGKGEEALALAQELVDATPDAPGPKMVFGNTLLALADFAAAEDTFRSIIADAPQNAPASMQLIRTLSAQGRIDDAHAQVDIALETSPNNPDLLWAKASFLERENDIDGAIDIYGQLYEINKESPVVANNLASLLVTYREDEESLSRAFTVGRRLRGADFPPFQDTYGWIQYRQGNFDEALRYLRPAAEALSSDPIVQFHLAKTYLSLGMVDAAAVQFQAVLDVADPSDTRPQIAESKAELERLSAESE